MKFVVVGAMDAVTVAVTTELLSPLLDFPTAMIFLVAAD